MPTDKRKSSVIKLDNTSYNLYTLSSDEGLFDLYYFLERKLIQCQVQI